VKIGSGDAPPTKAITTRQGPGTSILDQATSGNLPSTSTEDDDGDDGILVPSRKQQLRKERANLRSTPAAAAASQSKLASQTSSSPAPSFPAPYAHSSLTRQSGGGPSHAPLSDSDDAAPRLSKRAREEAQDRDSDDDGAKRGQMRRGTKQPIKRVGRRF